MPTASQKQRFAAQVLRQIARQIPAELKKAEEDNGKTARDIAMRLSSGSLTTKQLWKMGHPYATRDPQTPLRPEVINDQKGIFKQSWRVLGPETRFGALITRLRNIASYSGFMRGTKWMIPRPVIDEISDELAPKRKKRIREAMQKALTPRK